MEKELLDHIKDAAECILELHPCSLSAYYAKNILADIDKLVAIAD